MGRRPKLTNEQLEEELKAGLTKEEIAEKYEMNPHSVRHKMNRLSLREVTGKAETREVPAADCFAYDRFSGNCTCLRIGKCPGERCGFYKEAKQAVKEMERGTQKSKAYETNTEAAVMMVRKNQGISA
ncbi:hypothetical protein D3Z38_11665 [Clostridiales bacterium]|nr:hypothetical protein [Clostridiales bacterium]